jgi:hypothetical protein
MDASSHQHVLQVCCSSNCHDSAAAGPAYEHSPWQLLHVAPYLAVSSSCALQEAMSLYRDLWW